MKNLFLGYTLKDGLIIITLIILYFCILEIRKLKRTITREVQKRLIPQFNCELVPDTDAEKAGIYLKNESFFIARGIQFEDIALSLDDLGYRADLILKFEAIDSLKPQEKVKLNFQVLDKKQKFLPDVTERIMPHLIGASFKVMVYYFNIENLKSYAVFSKRAKKISLESIEPCP